MDLENLYDEQPEGPGFVGIKFCQEWYVISGISNGKLSLSDIIILILLNGATQQAFVLKRLMKSCPEHDFDHFSQLIEVT